MRTQMPVPFLYPVLYLVVLVSGLYLDAIEVADVATLPFVGGIGALVALDLIEWKRTPAGGSLIVALGLLGARALLYLVVCAADPTGISRVLLLLIPFRMYFLLGRAAALVASGVLLAGVIIALHLQAPEWYLSPEHVEDFVMFAVGLALTLAMAAVAAEERALRDRLRHSAAAAERARIGREIHDGLGHHLTAISVLLAKASAFRTIDPGVADAAVDDAREGARLALADVRRSVQALSDREPFDLIGAVKDLGRGLPVTIAVSGSADDYDDNLRLVVYRCVQEAITNALRHASAATIEVRLALGSASADMSVIDDGSGFDTAELSHALAGIRSRVDSVGGSLHVDSSPGGGTRVSVLVPRRSS